MIGSSVEKKEYDIFRELRDSIAMDIGIVQEAPNLSVSLVHHGIPEFKKNMKLNVNLSVRDQVREYSCY